MNAVAKKVLIVDDNPSDLKLANMILKKLGCQSLEIQDSLEVLDAANSVSFDLIILDLQMPQMSGLELLKRLKRKYNCPPVLIMSGRNAVSDVKVAIGLGASDYLVKPFDPKDMLQKAKRILGISDQPGAKSETTMLQPMLQSVLKPGVAKKK